MITLNLNETSFVDNVLLHGAEKKVFLPVECNYNFDLRMCVREERERKEVRRMGRRGETFKRISVPQILCQLGGGRGKLRPLYVSKANINRRQHKWVYGCTIW